MTYKNVLFSKCVGRLNNVTNVHESLNGTQAILGDQDSGRYFLCQSGETISFLGVCNGYRECSDGGDEIGCNRTSCKYRITYLTRNTSG